MYILKILKLYIIEKIEFKNIALNKKTENTLHIDDNMFLG